MIRLIASDMDGTLLNGPAGMPPETIDLINELDELGVRFCVGSGRRLPSLRELFAPVADKINYVASNGMEVAVGNELISVETFSRSDMLRLAEVVNQFDYAHLTCGVHGKTYCFDEDPAKYERFLEVHGSWTTYTQGAPAVDEDIVLGVVMGDYDFTHEQLWDWWLCPYPAEGIAVVLIALLLFPFKEWLHKKMHGRVFPTLVISFLVNMLVCASIDFTTGITANANFELWDYRDLPFNFMGQIVLQNTLVYSVAATFIVWVIYPLMAKWLHRMPQHYANGIFFGFVAFYVFLEVLYYVHIGPEGLIFG